MGDQLSEQKSRIAKNIRGLGDELEQTAQNGDGTVAEYAGKAAVQTREISDWIDTHEPRDVLAGVEDFARRRPVVFVLGAATLGLVVGRLTRSAVAVARDTSYTAPRAGTIDVREDLAMREPGGASMQPATGTTVPASDPHLTGEAVDEGLLGQASGLLQQRAYDAQSAYPRSGQPVELGEILPETGTSIGQGRRDSS